MIWDDEISFEGFTKKIDEWYGDKDFFELGDPPIDAQYALNLIFKTLVDDKDNYPYLTTMPESTEQINSIMLDLILSKYSQEYLNYLESLKNNKDEKERPTMIRLLEAIYSHFTNTNTEVPRKRKGFETYPPKAVSFLTNRKDSLFKVIDSNGRVYDAYGTFVDENKKLQFILWIGGGYFWLTSEDDELSYTLYTEESDYDTNMTFPYTIGDVTFNNRNELINWVLIQQNMNKSE